MFGLLAVAAIPAAIAAARLSARIDLIQAAAAIPVAAALGVLAVVTGRRGRGTLGSLRAGRERLASVGRGLGVLGLCLALTASISVGFYVVLVLFQ